MLNFVRKWYRKVFVFGLWFTVIVCALAGIVLGYLSAPEIFYGGYRSVPLRFMLLGASLGGVLGLLVGLWIVINVGGLIATFLHIDENLEKLNGK